MYPRISFLSKIFAQVACVHTYFRRKNALHTQKRALVFLCMCQCYYRAIVKRLLVLLVNDNCFVLATQRLHTEAVKQFTASCTDNDENEFRFHVKLSKLK